MLPDLAQVRHDGWHLIHFLRSWLDVFEGTARPYSPRFDRGESRGHWPHCSTGSHEGSPCPSPGD